MTGPALLALALLTPPAAPPGDPSRLLARLAASDPPIEEVQRAAASRAAAPPAEAASWRSRARWAHWLPRLALWGRHDDRSQHTMGYTSTAEVDYLRLAPNDEIGIRLSWDLPEIAFSEMELRAEEAAARAARRRAEAAERATKLYFRRRELIAALILSPPEEPRARAAAELAVDEATAQLDFLTGGLFGGRR